MEIGWYAPAGMEKAALVKEVGYDFIELGVGPLKIEDPEAMREAVRRAKACPLPTPVWNNFYPRDMRIVDPGLDVQRLKAYYGRVAEFLHAVGAETIVMGSAWSRNLPDGVDRRRAEEQIVEALNWAADAFAGSGARIAIEAQNKLECNFIRLVGEAVDLARKVDRPEIRAMADFYHMEMEREPLELLREVGPWLAHVQLADSDRLNPGSGSYPYDSFMSCLKQGGYEGRISVECMIEIPEEGMRQSLAFLREKSAIFE